MVLAIDTRINNKDYEPDYGNFIYQIFSRLVNQHPRHTFIFIADKDFNISSQNVIPVVITPNQKNNLLTQIRDNYKISSILKKQNADVLISTKCLTQIKIPQYLIAYNNSQIKDLKKVKLVIAQSEFSKKSIIEKYKIEDNKIEVIYPAADENHQPILFEEREKIKEEYADGNEYFLSPAISLNQNNLLILLKAFSIFKKRQKSSMQLLIVANAENKNEFLEKLKLYKYKSDVKVLEEYSKGTSAKIFASAYAIISLSSSAASANALLQSMQSKVPVITNNTIQSSEICTGAALYANGESNEDIANKMMQIFKDENLRRELIGKGKERIKFFNWDKSADEFWKCITTSVP